MPDSEILKEKIADSIFDEFEHVSAITISSDREWFREVVRRAINKHAVLQASE